MTLIKHLLFAALLATGFVGCGSGGGGPAPGQNSQPGTNPDTTPSDEPTASQGLADGQTGIFVSVQVSSDKEWEGNQYGGNSTLYNYSHAVYLYIVETGETRLVRESKSWVRERIVQGFPFDSTSTTSGGSRSKPAVIDGDLYIDSRGMDPRTLSDTSDSLPQNEERYAVRIVEEPYYERMFGSDWLLGTKYRAVLEEIDPVSKATLRQIAMLPQVDAELVVDGERVFLTRGLGSAEVSVFMVDVGSADPKPLLLQQLDLSSLDSTATGLKVHRDKAAISTSGDQIIVLDLASSGAIVLDAGHPINALAILRLPAAGEQPRFDGEAVDASAWLSDDVDANRQAAIDLFNSLILVSTPHPRR